MIFTTMFPETQLKSILHSQRNIHIHN